MSIKFYFVGAALAFAIGTTAIAQQSKETPKDTANETSTDNQKDKKILGNLAVVEMTRVLSQGGQMLSATDTIVSLIQSTGKVTKVICELNQTTEAQNAAKTLRENFLLHAELALKFGAIDDKSKSNFVSNAGRLADKIQGNVMTIDRACTREFGT